MKTRLAVLQILATAIFVCLTISKLIGQNNDTDGADLQSVPDKLPLVSPKDCAGGESLLDIFVLE